jgi:hypothetical protein
MKKALLALMLTTTPALAIEPVSPEDSAVLERRLFACVSYADYEQADDLAREKDMESLRTFIRQKYATKECVFLPKGMEVYAMQSRGRFECLRPKGDTKCFWAEPWVFYVKNRSR